MGKNIIYYGPPGTGKTKLLQNLKNNYIDFYISDDEIKTAYFNSSEDWILVTLILLQNNNLLSNIEIHQKIQDLGDIGFNQPVSTILEIHSVELSPPFVGTPPQIFKNINNEKWFVDLNKLLEYCPLFFHSYLNNDNIDERFVFVTFHQSFTYEDFIEGIRPKIKDSSNNDNDQLETNSGDIEYEIRDGVFKELCEKAKNNPNKEYAIFIDEINRGNISEIFGELISLIEIDKRLNMHNELTVQLPYSKKKFGVPQNVSIYGTMNTADRSIALIDVALRRRFEFIPITTNYELLSSILKNKRLDPNNIDGINVIQLLEKMNKRIQVLLDENFIIGHAYFANVTKFDDIKKVLTNKIIPLLEEYFFDDLEKVQLVLADLDENGELKSNAIYRHETLNVEELFEYQGELNLENKNKYLISDNITIDSITKIYSE